MTSESADLFRMAVHGLYYETAGTAPEVWCYTDQLSYAPGDTIRFHVSTSAKQFDLRLARDGGANSPAFHRRGLVGHHYDTPADCSVIGCGWPDGFEFSIPPDWPSGAYRVTCRIETDQGDEKEHDHLCIVRPAVASGSDRLLLVAATGTWTAYNDWGGSNHYEGITGPESDQYSPILSLKRPWARGFVSLPDGAPRVALAAPPEPGAPISYPHMTWACRNGYSKKYASSGWASYERHFVRWAEAEGYSVDVASQHDLHFRPWILKDYRCVVFVGHDEYWTWQMRDAVDDYVERGGRVARFAGNFMWQTRLEEEGSRQVCYKYRARAEDPLYGTENSHLTTTSWEAPEVGRPGTRTFGLNALRGIYTGWGGCNAHGPAGFTLYRPDHWAFEGTGLGYGDLLGARGRAFGYEVDGLDYVVRDGLAYASGLDDVPEDLEILALGLATSVERGSGPNGEPPFIGLDDARFVAETLYGEATPENVARTERGVGMVVSFRKGRGQVFHAGSCEWVNGLIHNDPTVTRVTKNVLDRFLCV